MKAMILAAGRGERMRPLTDTCPKPLLKVRGIPLIEHHIIKLAAAGFKDIVINHAWLGQQIEDYLGNGELWGVRITYSREGEQALETAGGIMKALPILCEADDTFLVVNGDVYTDYTFMEQPALVHGFLAHLCLVANPEHNSKGDFTLNASVVSQLEADTSQASYTFSGIAIYHKDFFAQEAPVPRIQALGPLLRKYSAAGKVSGQLLKHQWVDVGTVERLSALNQKEDSI